MQGELYHRGLVPSIQVSEGSPFWYAGRVKSSISILLFFVLSGFFLAALLAAIERSRRLLGIAAATLIVLTCIIVFVKPVQLPSLSSLRDGTANKVFTSSTSSSVPTTVPAPTTLAPGPASGAGAPSLPATTPSGPPGG